MRGAILGLAISTLLGTALFIVLMLLPSGLSHGLSALLPTCSSLFLLRMQASGGIALPPERPIDESHDGKAQTSRNGTAKLEARKSEVGSAVFSPQAPSRRGAWLRGIPLKLMFVVVLASFVGGAIRVFGPMQQLDLSGSTAWLGFCASDVCSMILSCVVAFYAHRHSIQTAFYIALPTMFIGCIAIASLPASWVQIGETVVSIGVTMIQTLIWALVLSKSLVRQRPPLGIFAITMASENLGYLLGQGMGSTVRLGTQTCLYASLFVILVIALVMVSMNGKLVVSHDALERPPIDPFEQRVKMISEQARLSTRETEVLSLWASGHTGAYLEATLGISKNTIKTHLSHIYGKTKTSNREELIALLESVEVAGETRLADGT